jgi:hypothetical protein
MARTYKAFNGPAPTTTAMSKVATGTSLKTLLQIAPPSSSNLTVIEWGISFDGSSAATPIQVELIEVDVAATVTAYVAADIVKLNQPGGIASQITLGVTASGYTSTSEGSITASRLLDYQLVAPTNQYVLQKPLGRDWTIQASKFLRVRVTAGASVSALCYVEWEE